MVGGQTESPGFQGLQAFPNLTTYSSSVTNLHSTQYVPAGHTEDSSPQTPEILQFPLKKTSTIVSLISQDAADKACSTCSSLVHDTVLRRLDL